MLRTLRNDRKLRFISSRAIAHSVDGNYAAATAAAERLVQAEPFNESAHQLRIRLLGQAGDRAGAPRGRPGGRGRPRRCGARRQEDLHDGPAARLGPGDDAAVVRARALSVTSTDAMVDGVHFRLGATASAADAGHRALAGALSDLAAMGAEPGEAYVVLGLPPGPAGGG